MIAEKVQVLIEMLKAGNGASVAVSDLKAVETQLGKTSDGATKLRNTLGGMFAGLSAAFIVNELMQASLAGERMNNALKTVTGSSQGAAREFSFVRREADRLGLELESNAGAYTKLSAAAKGTVLEGQAVKDIFIGIAEAGTGLNLSAAQQEGALQALQQMISKGTVQAEELRGQLGERLPGAFQIAARAMGVTTQELGKMLEQGQVMSADFLPRFAAELHRAFGPGAEQNARSLNAELNRTKTALFELKAALGADASGIFSATARGLRETAEALKENRELIHSVAIELGILALAFGTSKVVAGLTTMRASLLALATPANTIGLAFAGIGTAIWAAVEALRALDATSKEAASAQGLLEQTEARRKGVEREIELQERLGQITAKQASELKATLQGAFDARISNPTAVLGVTEAGPVIAPATTSPDVEARRRALREVSFALNPDMAPKPQSLNQPRFQSVVDTEGKQELIRTTEQLRSLQERLFIESLQGLDQEEARIQANYESRERQIEQLHRKVNLGTEELAQLRDLNIAAREADLAEVRLREQQKAKAEEEKRKTELNRQANEEMQRLEQQLTTQAVGSSETRVQQATREFEARVKLIDKLFAVGKIDAERWNELSIEAANQRLQAIASAAEAGKIESEKLLAANKGSMEAETLELERQFAIRRQNIEAFYELEKQKAEITAERIIELEQQKAIALNQLSFQQRVATSQIAQGMVAVGQAAQNQFAGGMARAFVSIADGSKSAKEAFADFARNFLRMIAEMILQTLILIAIRMALKSIPGVGALLSGGGQASSGGGLMAGEGGGSVANLAAAGGFFQSLRAAAIPAAAGVALAAGGIEGIQSVNSPTYLPGFNVLAGEAGREVLTVMAKPQMVEVNGVRAIMGSVGTKHIAMMSAEEMLAMNRPRMMQTGGMMPSLPTPAIGSTSNSGERISGGASIEVGLSSDLEARVIKNAIDGAVLRVTQELQQDGRLSASVKRLVR